MLRLFIGLLFVGMNAAAHASEEKSGKVPTPKPFPTPTMLASSDRDFPSTHKPNGNSVVLDRTAVFEPADVALGGTGTGSTYATHSLSLPKTEIAPATDARWRNNYGGGSRILTLVHHKHVELNGEQYKVTLHRDSALIETGSLKVGLSSGLTSMMWSKAL